MILVDAVSLDGAGVDVEGGAGSANEIVQLVTICVSEIKSRLVKFVRYIHSLTQIQAILYMRLTKYDANPSHALIK